MEHTQLDFKYYYFFYDEFQNHKIIAQQDFFGDAMKRIKILRIIEN